MYNQGIDLSNEIGDEAISTSRCKFTFVEEELRQCNFYIVAVPTPINSDKTPDLEPILNASRIVAKYISANDIIVYESTVYPGTTEEICIPLIEKISGLCAIKDFKFGYSPEEIKFTL
jgi:UDP-N-acetyl-D-galactosamine dehydrogenase